jgi:hypothetical protein
MSPFRKGVADVDSGRSIRMTEVWVKGLTILIPQMRRKSKKRRMMEMLGQSELGGDLFGRYNFSRSAHFSMIVLYRLFCGINVVLCFCGGFRGRHCLVGSCMEEEVLR